MNSFYPLNTETWGPEEKEAAIKVIESGNYTMGKQVEAFENEFAEYFGSKNAVMVNSGSSANLLAIGVLVVSGRLKKGDKVVVPALSWPTTYYPLLQYGLVPIFVDIDSNTCNIDYLELKHAISQYNPKAAFVVNVLGLPCSLNPILELCDDHGVILIEDNCESMGAKYLDKYAGTYGLIGTFSTFYSHHIHTMEGGMIVTDDYVIADALRSMRAHGWIRDFKHTFFTEKFKHVDDFKRKFTFALPGYNVRPLEISAAVGRIQLKKLEMFIAQRKVNFEYLKDVLNKNKGTLNLIGSHFKYPYESSFYGFPLYCNNDRRSDVIKLMNQHDIECRPIIAGNFTKQPVFDYFTNHIILGAVGEQKPLPIAEIISENGLFIGNDHRDLFEQINKIGMIDKKVTYSYDY